MAGGEIFSGEILRIGGDKILDSARENWNEIGGDKILDSARKIGTEIGGDNPAGKFSLEI